MPDPTLLIDGDIEIYRAACVNQEAIHWGIGQESLDANPRGAEDYLVSALRTYREVLGTGRMIVCFTSKDNWRKKLWPGYKANRKDRTPPVLLEHCRTFLEKKEETACWPGLEADDVMGLLSAEMKDTIIVSADKDMRCVPGRLYNPRRPDDGIVWGDDVTAHQWHMRQTLTGDSTDGYKGCPGVGQKKADALIQEIFHEVDPIRNYSSWRNRLWKAVVNTYRSKGLKAKDAILQARLSYILHRANEYDRKTGVVLPWTPPI